MAEDAILRLTDVGLAGEQNDGALRLHRLVGASVRTLLPDTGARHEVEQTLTQLAVEIGDAGDIRYARQLQPHLHLAAERALAGAGEHAADLAHGLGYVLWLFARYSQAQHYLERALELRADRDPLGVAGSYNLLALTYQVQSRFELARSMFEQAIELWTAHLAPGDERLVDEQHNLGYLYVVMGNYDAAASLLRRALYARRERYGLASLQVIRSLNGLGYLYILHNEYRSAKHYLRLARALGEQALPEHHSAHALTLMFLGRVLYFEQQPAAALNLLHRAAHIYYGLYGFESGAIAESYGYIGRIMGEQGDGDAWRYLEQALAIAERVMGDPNRDTAIVLMQCGSVARYQGQPARARAFFERAHGMLQQIHGASHPDLVTVERELAELARGA